MKKLTRNAVRCRKCNTIAESKHVHDFVWCQCKSTFTDGGLDYIRRGGDLDAMEDLNEYGSPPPPAPRTYDLT